MTGGLPTFPQQTLFYGPVKKLRARKKEGAKTLFHISRKYCIRTPASEILRRNYVNYFPL